MAGGRPLKFQSVDELQQQIDGYFSFTKEEEWTITGLALALDTSRETLMEYEGREEFVDTIKKAKLRVHNAYEVDLRRKGRSGDIFALKNFGWKDVTQQEQTIKAEITEGNNDALIEEYEKKLRETINEPVSIKVDTRLDQGE